MSDANGRDVAKSGLPVQNPVLVIWLPCLNPYLFLRGYTRTRVDGDTSRFYRFYVLGPFSGPPPPSPFSSHVLASAPSPSFLPHSGGGSLAKTARIFAYRIYRPTPDAFDGVLKVAL